MTNAILLSFISIATVGYVLLRLGRDRRVKGIGWVQGFMIIGLIPLGLQSLVLALFGFGEMASGDLSGVGHLFPLAATLMLALLSWKRPIEGGIALLIIGLTTMAEYSDAMSRTIMAAPQLISAGLFLAAGLGAWAISSRKQDQGH